MEEEEMKCPECSGIMEPGELLDMNYTITSAQQWSPSADSLFGLGVKGIRIISYRCIDCGFIKNYAPSEKRKKKLRKVIERSKKGYYDPEKNPDNLPPPPGQRRKGQN